MLNNIFLFALVILFVYVALFTIYFCIIVAASYMKFPKREKLEIRKEYKNIIVIIYSHNNEKTIVDLLEQLNKQDYPKGNYQTHIILDNCSDNSSNKLEFVGGAKLWRLTDDAPLGKDKAISWLLENLMSFKRVDAYVFLNATRNVKPDFLANINEALQENSVVVGSTEILLEDADFYDTVWSNVNEYNVNIMKNGRSKLGLAVPIDSDVMAIKHEVLEKVQCIDFKDANAELKYSFLLTSVNAIPKFVPKVKTYVSSIDYEVRRPEFSFKMSLFWHCLNLKSLSNPRFFEFLISLFKPNPIILMGIIALIGVYSFNYYFLFDFPWAVLLAVMLVVAFAASVYKSNLYLKPLFYLAFCPFFTFRDLLCEMSFIKKMFKFARKQQKLNVEKITVPVSVTNGRNVFSCSIDLISEDGFKKAVFHYKNKKQETQQSYVRMCDAVKNISDILAQHGFRMKICQSCAYFSPKVDGTNNMVKGYCNMPAVQEQNCSDFPETLLWSSCDKYIPQEVTNVIDIANYIKNK